MSYRDDLDAAHARIAALEAELAATKREPEPVTPAIVAPPVASPPEASARRIHFHAPPTYLPVLRRFISAVPIAFARRPGLRRSTSDNLLAYFGRNYVARPLVIAVWSPVYCVALGLVLPLLFAFYSALSIVLLPVVAISCLSFSPRYVVPKWLAAKDDDVFTILFLLLMGPWVALYLPALFDEREWPRR